jgi:ketosteroid isomerase-like protein
VPEGDDEVMRRSTEALNRGDIEGVLETFDPDVTFEPRRTSIQGAYSGHAGVREWWTDTNESFAVFRLELEEIREIGEGRLLVIGTLHVRGQGSGVEADIPSAAVIRLREGRIAEFKDYGERDKALEAAGLAG